MHELSLGQDDLREMVLRLAHEIRNPLAVIKSGVQLVQRVNRPEGDVGSCLSSILDQVERIDGTLRQVQRFVRLSAGRAVPVSVPDAVLEATRRRAGEVTSAGLEIVRVEGPTCCALVDPANLGVALDELLSNAIRFSPRGSSISLAWEASAQGVAIHVDDQGPGISADVEGQLGRLFFSTSTHGAGLGLAIASRACELAQGALSWSNRAGGGSRFTVTLPSA